MRKGRSRGKVTSGTLAPRRVRELRLYWRGLPHSEPTPTGQPPALPPFPHTHTTAHTHTQLALRARSNYSAPPRGSWCPSPHPGTSTMIPRHPAAAAAAALQRAQRAPPSGGTPTALTKEWRALQLCRCVCLAPAPAQQQQKQQQPSPMVAAPQLGALLAAQQAVTSPRQLQLGLLLLRQTAPPPPVQEQQQQQQLQPSWCGPVTSQRALQRLVPEAVVAEGLPRSQRYAAAGVAWVQVHSGDDAQRAAVGATAAALRLAADAAAAAPEGVSDAPASPAAAARQGRRRRASSSSSFSASCATPAAGMMSGQLVAAAEAVAAPPSRRRRTSSSSSEAAACAAGDATPPADPQHGQQQQRRRRRRSTTTSSSSEFGSAQVWAAARHQLPQLPRRQQQGGRVCRQAEP
jgi:hypothetical protein